MKPCISQATTLSTPFEADIVAYAMAGWSARRALADQAGDVPRSHSVAEAQVAPRSQRDPGRRRRVAGGAPALPGRRAGRPLRPLPPPARPAPSSWRSRPWSSPPTSPASSRPRTTAGPPPRWPRRRTWPGPPGSGWPWSSRRGAQLCSSLDTALALIAQAGAENVGVCLDLFHYYTGPSKFEDLAYLSPENLAWVQVCDLSGVPRELAGDADRIFPGEGDFQIGPILDHLASIGYEGFVSLEVLNPQLWAIPADRVADAGRQAMERLLDRPDPPRAASTSWGIS